MFLGLDIKDIGQIGAGKERITKAIDVAMVQSLARRDDLAELVAGYGHVIVDECHHVSAVSFERVVAAAKARYVVGLTATPKRRDGHHPIVAMQLGPVRFAVDAKSQGAGRPAAVRAPLVRARDAIQLAERRCQDPGSVRGAHS
ncbi:MAG: DEAD/DEAH box helicase family protein [Kofleriaceae bacterium]